MDRKYIERLGQRAALWLLLLAVPLAAQNGEGRIQTSDLMRINTLRSVQISPDGEKAVCVVTSVGNDEAGKPRYHSHLWLMETEAASPPRQLTFGERRDGSPAWSPDGSRIAFIREHDGKPQIWVLPLEGGEAVRITETEFGAASPRWSPDGELILFTSRLPEWALEEEPTWNDERPGRSFRDTRNWRRIKEGAAEADQPDIPKPSPDGDLNTIREWLAKNAGEDNPRIFTRLSLQGENHLQPRLDFEHIFVVSAHGRGEERRISKGMQNFRDPCWAVDGKQIICASVRFEQHPDRVQDSDLWIVNADGTESRPLLHWQGYKLSRPVCSPDGKQIAFLASGGADPGYEMHQLALVPAKGGDPRGLTFSLDRGVGRFRWSLDGKSVLFTASDHGTIPLLQVTVAGGDIQPLIQGALGIQDFDAGEKRIVAVKTEVENPYELISTDRRGGDVRYLSSFNSDWIKEKRVVVPVENWLVRPDGSRVQYWVMEPARRESGKRYPLVLEIHGGPSSMWGPGEATMWHEFQLLCSWGYGVVFCNPRGSGGYGYDFLKANYRDWGVGPAGDILAAADAAARLEWVDPKRQVVTGGSYAGYMTAWIVSQDHRFQAAVAQRGVYELSLFFGEGRAWRLVPDHFGGYPWQEDVRPFLDANSPQTFVRNIRTPLLIMHSDLDIRTGTIQSEFLYKSLKALERPVEYVRYPGEGHELSRSGDPHRRMDRLNRIIEFFERYIRH